MFWAVAVSFAFVEQNILFFVMDYMPLYLELKFLAFVWLAHPNYWGAAWIWQSKLKAVHKKYDELYYDKVTQGLGPLGQVEEKKPQEAEPKKGAKYEEEVHKLLTEAKPA